MRKRQIVQRFTSTDRRRLRRALRATIFVRVYRRLEAVLLVAEGTPIAAVAAQRRTSRRNVARWVRRYLTARDPAALSDAPRSGRPRRTELSGRSLLALLRRDPRA